MACDDARELFDGYLDDELDVATGLEVRRHLRECPECAAFHQKQQALRAAMRRSDLVYRAPAGLEMRIRAAMDHAEGVRPARAPRFPRIALWLAAAASILIAAVLLWRTGPIGPDPNELMARAVLANHVRSMMATHLTDVDSSDNHTVKPWFNGKLDFSPPVKDLAAENFPLAGGRLEYLDRPVAALVYRRRQHIINVFVWPASGDSRAPAGKEFSRQGYNLMQWTSSGMNYWAASDLNLAELRQFAHLLQQ